MIENLIKPESIIFELSDGERDEVLAELTENLIGQDATLNRNEVFQSLVEREEKMSTVVEKMIAVPHAVCKSACKTLISLGISRSGIDFNLSTDDETDNDIGNIAKVIFCVVFPEDKTEEHLAVLKDILSLSQAEGFLQRILLCKNIREICDLIYNLLNE